MSKENRTRSKTVLVVDDESDLRQFSVWLLEAEGYQTLQAADGTEGIRLARQENPDLVLLDIRMPDRYGWTILAEIKNTPALCHMPVVIFTASADAVLKSKAVDMGAADYLIKPVSAETLKICVNRILKSGSTRPD
jgi:DNA-binding response OmpR family regulator